MKLSRHSDVYIAARLTTLEQLGKARGLRVDEQHEAAALLEIQERRAADLGPDDADALAFALGAVHFYAGSVGCSATSKEIKAASDLLEKIIGTSK